MADSNPQASTTTELFQLLISHLSTEPKSLLNLHELVGQLSSRARQFYPDEKEQLLSIAALAEEETKNLDEDYRNLLVAIRSRRVKSFEAARRAKSLIAPVRRLPPDILLEIFTLICDEAVFVGQKPSATKIPGLQLTAVCSLWRNLVNATGRMWSNITVMGSKDNACDLSVHQMAVLKWILTMSKDATLRIQVTLNEHTTSSLALPMLKTHCHRWRSFTLVALPQVLNDHFGTSGRSHVFPELQHLSLAALQTTSTDPNLVASFPPMTLDFNAAPKLRSAWLNKLGGDMEYLAFGIPWTQLRNLRMCPSNGREVFDALARNQLLSLELVPGRRRFNIPPLPHFITSPLTELTFKVRWDIREYTAVKAVFENITLPSLNILRINQRPYQQAPSSDAGWPVEAFRSLVQRSKFELRKLTLVHVPMSDVTLISILECVPDTVEELIIREPTKKCFLTGVNDLYGLSSITDRLVERLHVGVSWAPSAEQDRIQDSSTFDSDLSSSGGGALLPALRHLELSCKGKPSELHLVKFVKMVQSRCPRGPEARVPTVGMDSDAAAFENPAQILAAPPNSTLKAVSLYVSMQSDKELKAANRMLEEDLGYKLPAELDVKIVQQADS
jgi:hypothetical protein